VWSEYTHVDYINTSCANWYINYIIDIRQIKQCIDATKVSYEEIKEWKYAIESWNQAFGFNKS
jgi:hypothetical protein